jgi:MFS family permease
MTPSQDSFSARHTPRKTRAEQIQPTVVAGEPSTLRNESPIERGNRPEPTFEEKTHLNNADDAALDVRTITGFRWVLVCFGLYLSALMYGLDTTIVADIQGAVIEEFGGVSQLSWIGSSFPLGSVAVILPYGFLFTAFNMKWLYIGGVVLFQAGSALCDAATNMNALIVGRVLAGAGGTGIYLGGLNQLSALTTRQERGTYLTGTGFVWGLGAVLGPLVGGGFADSSATWRWGFYINLVFGAVTAPIYLFYLPPINPAPGKSLREKIGKLDYLGFVLSAAMWVFFALGFISAGGIWLWNDGRATAFVTLFGILLVAYGLQQYLCIFTTPETRSFPGHLLKSRTQVLLYIATTTANTCMFFTTYYIPIYFQFAQNDSAVMAAVRLLPYLMFTIFLNLGTGWALPKVKYYMPICLVSGILTTLASSLFYAQLSPNTPTSQIYGFSILLGIGSGMTMQLGYAVGSLKVPVTDIFSAINLQNIAQIGATVICLVIAGQVFQSTAIDNMTRVLAGEGYSQADIRNAVAGTQSTLFQELSKELRADAVQAVTDAIKRAFIIPLVAGMVSVLAALAMRREKIFN